MKSSKTTLKNLNDNLNYLEWYIDSENSDVIEGCKKQVQDLEKIINELIKETALLNKALKLMDETHEMTLSRLTTVSRIATVRGKAKRD